MKSAQLFYRSDRLTAILYFNDCVHIEVVYNAVYHLQRKKKKLEMWKLYCISRKEENVDTRLSPFLSLSLLWIWN